MSLTKAYATIVAAILYHVIAWFGMLTIVNLHIPVISTLALVWLLTLPISIWIAAKKIGQAYKVIARSFNEQISETEEKE